MFVQNRWVIHRMVHQLDGSSMCRGASPIECPEATRMWHSHCLETDGHPPQKGREQCKRLESILTRTSTRDVEFWFRWMVSFLCCDKAKEADSTMWPAWDSHASGSTFRYLSFITKSLGSTPPFTFTKSSRKTKIHLKDPRTMLDTSPDSLSHTFSSHQCLRCVSKQTERGS